MKIALVYFSFLPTVGGIEKQVSQIAISLADSGHSVEVLTTKSFDLQKADLSSQEAFEGFTIRRFGYFTIPGYRYTFFSPSMALYLWRRTARRFTFLASSLPAAGGFRRAPVAFS